MSFLEIFLLTLVFTQNVFILALPFLQPTRPKRHDRHDTNTDRSMHQRY